MLVSPHVTTGVVLGALIGNPIVVVPAAVASHFVLDSVPHWQETMAPYIPTWKTYVRIPIDVAIAAGVIWLGLQAHPDHALAIWLGAVAACLPDADVITIPYPWLRRGWVQKHWDWHCLIQRETTSMIGVATQLAVLAVGVVLINL